MDKVRILTLYDTPRWEARLRRLAKYDETQPPEWVRQILRRHIDEREVELARRSVTLPKIDLEDGDGD